MRAAKKLTACIQVSDIQCPCVSAPHSQSMCQLCSNSVTLCARCCVMDHGDSLSTCREINAPRVKGQEQNQILCQTFWTVRGW